MSKEMSPNELKRWRMKRGLSQHDAAQILGYKERTIISHLEAGRKRIHPRVRRLCELLDEKEERNDTLGQRT